MPGPFGLYSLFGKAQADLGPQGVALFFFFDTVNLVSSCCYIPHLYSKIIAGALMKTGFTLIELLVVVLIIGILAAVALPQYEAAVEKSRASEALLVVKTVTGAVRMDQLQNGEFVLHSGGSLINLFRNLMESADIQLPPGEWVQRYYYQTNHFIYGISAGTKNHNGQLSAHRWNKGDSFSPAFMPSRNYSFRASILASGEPTEMACFYKNAMGKRICSSLPGEWLIMKDSSL